MRQIKFTFLIIQLSFLGCGQSSSKGKGTELLNINSLNSHTQYFSFNEDVKDRGKFAFDAEDGYVFGICSICFIDSNHILVVDNFNNNLKIIEILNNTARISMVKDDFNNTGFNVGKCHRYNDRIYILDDVKNQFMAFDLSLSQSESYSFQFSITEDPPSFAIKEDSLFIICEYYNSSLEKSIFDTYSVFEQRYYRDDRLKYDELTLFGVNHVEVSETFKSLKQTDSKISSVLNDYIAAKTKYEFKNGEIKYALISFNEDERIYNLLIR